MGNSIAVTLSNGEIWHVTNGLVSGGASACVPIQCVEYMSDEEIGRFLRECKQAAEILNVSEQAYIYLHGTFEYDHDELEDLFRLFGIHRRHSPTIAQAYSRLVDIRDCGGRVPGPYYKRPHDAPLTALDKHPSKRSNEESKVLKLAERDGWQCHYCDCDLGLPRLTHVDKYGYAHYAVPDEIKHAQIEHKTPRARGGGDHMDNLVLSCPACNMRKGARYSYEEFVALMREELRT